MNLGKLQKQLLRDLKKSPLKAGALGLLSLVAVYFWAPLVLGYFSKEKPAASAGTPEAVVATAAVAAPAASAAPTPQVGLPLPWKQLAQIIEKDPRMASADARLAFQLPFGDPGAAAAEPDEEHQRGDAEPQAVEQSLEPDKLGLKLTGTMVSGRRRVAVINGRPYAEGSQIQVGNGLVLDVSQVTERHVVLLYKLRRLELAVADASPAGGGNFEIQPTRAKTNR